MSFDFNEYRNLCQPSTSEMKSISSCKRRLSQKAQERTRKLWDSIGLLFSLYSMICWSGNGGSPAERVLESEPSFNGLDSASESTGYNVRVEIAWPSPLV